MASTCDQSNKQTIEQGNFLHSYQVAVGGSSGSKLYYRSHGKRLPNTYSVEAHVQLIVRFTASTATYCHRTSVRQSLKWKKFKERKRTFQL